MSKSERTNTMKNFLSILVKSATAVVGSKGAADLYDWGKKKWKEKQKGEKKSDKEEKEEAIEAEFDGEEDEEENDKE